ncbi:MAG: hypothetical protein ABIQ07_04750 [Ginsengibacter sp.]
MMKLKLSCVLLFSLVVCVSCNTSPYGKKVKVNDRIEVFIKNEANEAEAKKLGNFIDSTWKMSTNQKSFQLSKDIGQYTVRMVVDENKIKEDSSLDVSFMAIQFLLEENVFKGSKVILILTNDSFKDIKSFQSHSFDLNSQEKNNSDSAKSN